jgi:2-dehydro-3-deoxy-D-arabinonate dehydratase
MKLFNTTKGVILSYEGALYDLPHQWDPLINRQSLHSYLKGLLPDLKEKNSKATDLIANDSLAPIGSQEVWAAGVTYFRSKEARMDESQSSGGATFYDKVYDAERPELFFKATPHRVVGHNGTVNIRRDSTWNVPEPELTLFINSNGNIEGYTIGNDMSSRSIEGENPLYLPQAKTYDRSAALGPCLFVPATPIDPASVITMEIIREGRRMYNDYVQINQMKRAHSELAAFLYKESSFPTGCFLMTGTCLVPPTDFTLAFRDVIHIAIDGIGMLTNTVGTKEHD